MGLELLLAVGALLGVLGSAAPAAFAETCKTGAATFESKGEQQCYEVPSGVTKLEVTAVSGKGGQGEYVYEPPGLGATVSGVVAINPGTTLLYVEVGADGCEGCAVFGGGGQGSGYTTYSGSGGGASDVREKPLAQGTESLESRLLVAGGGGGAGFWYGGAGGNAGTEANGDGQSGSNGDGAGYYGEAEGGEGGKGGTSEKGGMGGMGGYGYEITPPPGSEGTFGAGGAGGPSGEDGNSHGAGGGGGGWYGGGGGGGGGVSEFAEFEGGGGGGGAGSSYAAPGVSGVSIATDSSGEAPRVTIDPIAPNCTTVMGHGVYKKVGEPGRLKLEDSLSTELSSPQMLHVKYQSGKIHFRLVKLEHATCEGAAGERDFHGEGAAATDKETGYTLSFSIYEKGGGFFFESKLMKGAELVEASGGPLMKSTEKIT